MRIHRLSEGTVVTLAEAAVVSSNLTANTTHLVLPHGLTSNNIDRIFVGFF
jgi:hypothetical protein